MGWLGDILGGLSGAYSAFLADLPSWVQQVVNLFLWILVIFIYVVIVWKFYRFIARKNIISLNLGQYNRSEHPVFSKIIGSALYLIEYILILPFLVFLWFAVFSILLILLAEELDVAKITLISAVIIGAIRLVAYTPRYGQELAKEVSKLLPFTLLAITITRPDFVFDFSRLLTNLAQVPDFFGQITLYLLFIVFLEMALRLLDFFLSVFGLKEMDPQEDD